MLNQVITACSNFCFWLTFIYVNWIKSETSHILKLDQKRCSKKSGFLIHFCNRSFGTLVDQKRTVWYLILEIKRTCKCKMCILSAEGFFEIELCQKTRISLIKLYDKYLPFCNFYALVSHAIFFSRKTHSQKSKKKCLKVGIVSSRSR